MAEPTVRLAPSFRTLIESELPPPGFDRWTPRRKAAVINGLRAGVLREDEAVRDYGLSRAELLSWAVMYDTHGVRGLGVRTGPIAERSTR